ncbi:PilC/PilY family type IV pilus protein [Pseudomonas stutzeri]|nr:PilC/PilY family type IV pilus protein [Stutzerimonas stutzeri]
MMLLWKRLSLAMAGTLLAMLSMFVQAEDIDVFVGGTGGSGGQPNILILLDNTSNWARQSQKWPGGITQGQSEVRAIKTALNGLVGKVNVGMMAFTTGGDANQDGGFVRFDLQPLTASSQVAFNGKLDQIFNNINSPVEKRNSGTPWGNLMYDVYNYLVGRTQSFAGAGTPASLADSAGYSTLYSTFASPLDAEDACVKTYVIFIGNPSQSGPSTDSSANSSALAALYAGLDVSGTGADKLAGQSSGTPLPIPLFTTTETTSTYIVPAGTESFFTTSKQGNQCYTSVTDCSSDLAKNNSACPAGSTCTCLNDPPPVASGCNSGNNYTVRAVTNSATTATSVDTQVTPTGQYNTTKGANWNLDDWAKFLFQHGVPITTQVTEEDEEGVPQTRNVTVRMPVVTYTIDVFNAQQNADHTGLMMSTATVGGGKYFAARNEDAIVDALNKAASEILSASSTFAAVALPLSATNRAQNENQVFIGMFRPNSDASPRWFGNLKRYQVGLINGKAELVDVNRDPAINTLTNFPSECAKSFWSTDSGTYWQDKNVNPSPLSKCVGATTSPWSDAPDGPFVEKGGAAQALRNYPSSTARDISSRNVLTVGSNGLTAFNSSFATSVPGGQPVIDYVRGHATDSAGNTVNQARPTIHGDVVHSRPLPINYGVAEGNTAATIRVFYGTNDGLLRAIDAATGKESWSFVAPEHFGRLQRLKNNQPLVAFPNQDPADNPEPKGYFFDGAIGSHLEYDQQNRVTKAYIFPTMRRGGRMVYAFDVTDPEDPELLWRKGCPLATSDTGCDTGFSGIGQTWSLPRAAYLKGYENGDAPVVIFGGGYDNCEDTDATTTTCTSSAKGRAIYVVDAEDGSLVAAIPTTGSVSADVTLVDIDYDGYTDYAYTVDLSGNVWRVNFVDPTTKVAADVASATWAATAATKIAYTSGGARKFLNAPSALPYQGKVYLAFGSGNRERPLTSNYPYKQDIDDRYYVFLDYPANNTAYDLDGAGMSDFTAPTSCETAGIYPSDAVDAKRGWYMSLPGRGEQVVTTSVIAGGVVAFNTYQPGGTPSPGMCTRPMGIASSYQVNLFNASGAVGVDGHCGGERSIETGTGMPISPTVGTVVVKTNPSCTGDSCDEDDGDAITFCIGCEGLTPTEIEPKIDQTRSRTYWNSDIDR